MRAASAPRSTLALMASTTAARGSMRQWLDGAGYQADTGELHGDAIGRPVHHTLVTYYPSAAATGTAVTSGVLAQLGGLEEPTPKLLAEVNPFEEATPELLAEIPTGALWVHCGPMTPGQALAAAHRAALAGVAFCAAPLDEDPAGGERSRCRAHEPSRPPRQGNTYAAVVEERVLDILAALSTGIVRHAVPLALQAEPEADGPPQ